MITGKLWREGAAGRSRSIDDCAGCRRPLQRFQGLPGTSEIDMQYGIRGAGCRCSRDNQNIQRRQCSRCATKRLAYHALDPIALDGTFADLARHCKSQPSALIRGFEPTQQEMPALPSAARMFQCGEIGGAAKPRIGRQAGHANPLRNQALATLGASRRQHLAAIGRFHASAKTVGTGALENAGLVGTFHG